MHNPYKHVGQHLKMSIARELILEFFAGQSGIKRQDIIDKVEEEHQNRGGLEHTKPTHPVTDALDNLKKRGLADNPNTGFWDIKRQQGYEPAPVAKREYPPPAEIKKGCVYFYYFPTSKENAYLKGENRWPFKIGYTETGDPQDRVEGQVTAMSEEPEIEVVIYTESPRHLEQIIHDSLKKQNMHIQEAPGKEWFLLSPNMVKKIKEAFEVFEKSLDFQMETGKARR